MWEQPWEERQEQLKVQPKEQPREEPSTARSLVDQSWATNPAQKFTAEVAVPGQITLRLAGRPPSAWAISRLTGRR